MKNASDSAICPALLLAAFAVVLSISVAYPALADEPQSAYVASLDIASLPYGHYESGDIKRLIEERYAVLGLASGHGLYVHISGSGGGDTPAGMRMLALLFGASEAEAKELLAAAAQARNVTNPKLLTARVYHPESIPLPEKGGQISFAPQGSMMGLEGELIFVPNYEQRQEVIEDIKALFRTKLNQEVDFSYSSMGYHIHFVDPEARPEPIPLASMPPDFRRQHAVARMGMEWPRYNWSEPWFAEPVPVQPLQGGTWVKGSRVNMMRFDAASDATVARLLADAEEFVRRVRERYPSAAVAIEFNDRRELTPGKQAQPMLDLFVAVDDEAFLEQIGEELSARAAIDAGYPRIMGVHAGWRVPFLGAAAQAAPGLLIDRSLIVKRGFVFPPGMGSEAIDAEIRHWEDQWLELWEQSR